MRSDDCSSNNDRQGIGEIPHQPGQRCSIPKPHHLYWESNDNHRAEYKTQDHRGRHSPSLGHERNHETNEQECDEVSDVNSSGCEEHIRAEVMLVNVVSLKHCKYRRLDRSSDKLPQKKSSAH